MAQGNAVTRFIDADQEPTKTLTPLHGYEGKRLVSSLEEAVDSIEPPIHNLKSMVWTAKRNSENPSDGLTSAESASIHFYTMEWPEGHDSFCTLLNKNLRSEKRNELKSWYLYLKLFLTALHKLPSIKKVIWRGIRGDISHLYGKDYIWWGVSSCTETMSIMERFVGRSGVRTLFMIECINGKVIKSHSFHKDEDEVILMPGTYLRVIDKWTPANDVHMIHLQEETPPCQLVASPFTSSSSVNTLPKEKLSVPKDNQPNYRTASTQTHESETTTSLLSSPPKHKNPELEQMIKKHRDEPALNLSKSDLTDDDIEFIAYYLLRDNKLQKHFEYFNKIEMFENI